MSSFSFSHLKVILDIVNNGKREKRQGKVTNDLKESYGIGTKSGCGNKFRYCARDVQVLHKLLDNIGIDPKKPPISKSSRTDNGSKTNNEKLGAGTLFSNPICIKVTESGSVLNNVELTPTGIAHIQINLDDINDIRAQSIILIENLDTFKQIGQSMIDMNLNGVIFVWRGSISGVTNEDGIKVVKTISVPNTEKAVNELACQYAISLGYYGDFDIAGLNIASRLDLDYLILPSVKELNDVRGNKELYQKQQGIKTNSWQKAFSEAVENHVDFLTDKKQAYTQERTSALKIKHFKVDVFS